jgi:hypothetical protein
MKTKQLVLGAVSVAAGMLTACHDDHQGASSPPPPPPHQSQSLDTAQVLALAQQPSETSNPMPVNGGAVVINDTSETSAPITVNAM